jgi:methylation protein EvaC
MTSFLDLGKQPVANNLLNDSSQFGHEYKFNLTVNYEPETKLVSLGEFVPPEMMFNDSYVYHSSMSKTMKLHFANTANFLEQEYHPKSIVEIGSNDGVFLRHFPPTRAMSVEPCGNFANLTRDMGYNTLNCFWNDEAAEEILRIKGKQDVIYAANCMCHIQDIQNAFKNVSRVISKTGVFIFEDPSLLNMLDRGSYDQLYGAHAYIFSVTALSTILKKYNLDIFKVQEIHVHGGSNRIFACPSGSRPIEDSVKLQLKIEQASQLDCIQPYNLFAKRVAQSKTQLVELLTELKKLGSKIVGYGATAKITTVFNYCNIDTSLVDYIVDTTPSKQGKFLPGVYIPVISPETGFDHTVDYAFLGAWNYEKEIVNKEKDFLTRGRFISHIPHVRVIDGK